MLLQLAQEGLLSAGSLPPQDALPTAALSAQAWVPRIQPLCTGVNLLPYEMYARQGCALLQQPDVFCIAHNDRQRRRAVPLVMSRSRLRIT